MMEEALYVVVVDQVRERMWDRSMVSGFAIVCSINWIAYRNVVRVFKNPEMAWLNLHNVLAYMGGFSLILWLPFSKN
jgi:predicted Kef-type K+ transport protein